MTKKMLTWILLGLLALVLAACGSNRDAGDSIAGDGDALAGAMPLGIDNCLTCHQGGSVAPLVADVWAAGVHGNPDASPNGLFNPFCLSCHDQLGDGAALTPARPVVSCESCHGGGQFHYGIPSGIPFPTPDPDRCGQCHNAAFPHGFAPEGVGIVEDFVVSPHTRSLNEHVFVDGTSDVRARCAKCHSDEGAKQFLNVDGNYAFLSSALPNSAAPLSGVSAISCRTCHTPHNESTLLEDETIGAGNVLLRSAQFNTCTNCHQLINNDLTRIVAYHDPAANPFGAPEEIITDTHFATPGNWLGSDGGQNQNDISGYAMDFADERVCLNCHNPHNADNTPNQQWAESKHADTTAAGAWAHYNWTEVSGAVRNDGSATSNRTSCQRCHTTRGLVKLLTETNGDTTAYVPFSDYDANYRPEMLHCNGCHSDSLGTVRSVGPITVDFATVGFTFPDALTSNLCLACHTGRESGLDIKADTDADGTRSFINSHYLTAGGTVYTATGYEYDGQNYDNLPDYEHDLIGTPSEPGTGDNVGPCVGCHMSAPEKHRFQPVVTDESTELITEIVSPVCAVCHTGQLELTPTVLNEEKEDFHAALESLNAQLAAQGMFFFNAHPYFYNAPGGTGGSFTTWGAVAVSLGLPAVPGYKDVMGAAFNFNLLEHDPGAFVHNRIYAKRLIFDSIDFLDDGALNVSVEAAIDALVTAGDLDLATADLAKFYLDGDGATAGVQRP